MKLIDIVTGAWAIRTETLMEIQSIYATHLRGEKINVSELEKRLGNKLENHSYMYQGAVVKEQVDNSYGTFSVVNGIAIIPIHDVMAKRMNMFMSICGGTSTELIQRDIQRALDDPKIKGIIAYFDTPGGTVDGTAELADFIYQSRGQKPLIGFTDGMCCSAGYWAASACDEIYISSDTVTVGSIGVVAGHQDISKRQEMSGVKTTEITAGKYKRISSQYAPLTAEGQADIQDKVDYLYSVFVNDVARNRSTTPEQCIADMADGRVFIGMQNIDNGLVDGVSTLDALITQMAGGQPVAAPVKMKRTPAGAARGEINHTTNSQEVISMDLTALKKDHPALVAQIETEARAGMVSEATASAESARVLALVGAAFGAEAGKKFSVAVDKGFTADDIATLGITFGSTSASDDKSRSDILSALQDGGTKPLKSSTTTDAADDNQNYLSLVIQHQKDNPGVAQSAAMSAVAAKHPEAHAAYITKANEGRK